MLPSWTESLAVTKLKYAVAITVHIFLANKTFLNSIFIVQEVIPDALLVEDLALDDVEVMEFFMILANEFGKPT